MDGDSGCTRNDTGSTSNLVRRVYESLDTEFDVRLVGREEFEDEVLLISVPRKRHSAELRFCC